MRTFRIDEFNDLARGAGGNLERITGIEAIAQTAKQYMRARLGEMFLNADQGIPFADIVWAGSPNVAQFEAAGRARLLEVDGVVEVLNFEARQTGDVLGYTATMRTVQGEVTIGG